MLVFQTTLNNIVHALESITFNLGKSQVSLLAITQLVFYCLLILVLTHYLNRLLKQALLHRLILEQGIRYLVANLVSYSLGAFILILVLQSVGVNLSSLTVVGGALGLGIGLGLQNLTRNFVGGFTLLVEQKIKIGDYIRFQDIQGYVREVSPRAVVVALRDGSSVILPNTMLIEQQVINYHYDNEAVRLTIPVGVAYGTDPVLVTETLLMSAYSQSLVLKKPPAQVIFESFGDHALLFELRVWIPKREIAQHPEISSALRYAISFNFRRNHIVIPFPQQDLWLKNPETMTPIIHPDRPLAIAPLEENNTPLVSVSQVLQSSHYFQGLNELEVRQLIEIGQLQTLGSGEILFQEQDVGDAFYVVISGSVEVYTEKLGRVLAQLSVGSFFGELSLMLGIPRTASVRALEKTLLFVIHIDKFEQLLRNNGDFHAAILEALSQHQAELEERRAELEAKGLLSDAETGTNIMDWVRQRLQSLFGLA